MCKFVSANSLATQEHTKARYDAKTFAREFKEGYQVPAYLPVPGFPIFANYQGPYCVNTRVNDGIYIMNTPDRRKTPQLLHINLLKPYLARKPSYEPLRRPCTVINIYDYTIETLTIQ